MLRRSARTPTLYFEDGDGAYYAAYADGSVQQVSSMPPQEQHQLQTPLAYTPSPSSWSPSSGQEGLSEGDSSYEDWQQPQAFAAGAEPPEPGYAFAGGNPPEPQAGYACSEVEAQAFALQQPEPQAGYAWGEAAPESYTTQYAWEGAGQHVVDGGGWPMTPEAAADLAAASLMQLQGQQQLEMSAAAGCTWMQQQQPAEARGWMQQGEQAEEEEGEGEEVDLSALMQLCLA